VEPSEFAKLKPGRILFSCVPDMQGRAHKDRPVVVLSTPESDDPDTEFYVASGSTKSPEIANVPFAICVKGINKPGGHPRTGLTEDTWFYALWILTVKVGMVRRLAKSFPAYDFMRFQEMIRVAAIKASE